MSVENLWGEVPTREAVKLPVTILKQQATVLGDLTNRILEAEIVPVKAPSEDKLDYALEIVAPALGNYHYKVLHIEHDAITNYPVFVTARNNMAEWHSVKCDDEAQFITHLKGILSSPAIHNVIASLMAQSKVAA